MSAHYPSPPMKIFAGIGALVAWFAVILQLYLIILHREMPVPATLLHFFSFFTIQVNILSAFCYTALWFSKTRWGKIFSRPKTLTAVTAYIIIVGAVYNLVLRSLWQPEGWQWLADELLHSVSPLFFFFFWIVFVPKYSLRWTDTIKWLIYPLLYLVYILVRGAITALYPYPFMEVTTLGYPQVLLNSLMVAGSFLGVSLLLVALGKLQVKNRE